MLLKKFYSTVKQNSVILAPTGVAAINIGGQTIHRFFGFPPRLLRYRDPRDIPIFGQRSPRRKLLQAVHYLIIDEISMARADIIDAIDWSLRVNRENTEPFGGVRLITFGDIMQLEPVVASKEEREYIKGTWGSPFFFDAQVWTETPFMVAKLTKVHRQERDPEFLDLLTRLRTGDLSSIRHLNGLVRQDGGERDGVVILAPRRREVDEINSQRLLALPGHEFRYEASIEGTFSEDEMPTERLLILKKGAQVMLLRNSEDYVNGDIGFVEEADTESVIVRLRRGVRVRVREAVWEKIKYEYDAERKEIVPKVIGKFKQLPLRLAWAVTIHKAQGLTLEEVHIELGRGMFAHGQLYVALTRARSHKGLTLSRPIAEADVIWETHALEFERRCEDGILWRRQLHTSPSA
jgi:ATP-dependent exoDNAse (exonuclease V) alpha subunit